MNSKGINNVIRIPATLENNFFRVWVEFLTPLHNLTAKEKDVLAAFLKNRFELSNAVIDNNLLDELLMSDKVRTKIKEECNISEPFLKVILSKLKKVNILVEGKINPLLIPKTVKKDDKSFMLLLYFDLNETNIK